MSADCSPQVSLALMSAPASSSTLAASILPVRAAAISGVSPLGVLKLGSAPALSSASNDGRSADDRGFGDGRGAKLVRQFDVRARFDQRTDQFQIAVRRGVHDGGGAVGAGGVYVRALGAQQPNSRDVIARSGRCPAASNPCLYAPANASRHACRQNCNPQPRNFAYSRPPRDRRRRRRWTSPGSRCAGAA